MYKVPFNVDLSKKVIAITGAGGIICGEFAKALAAWKKRTSRAKRATKRSF